MYFIIRSIFWIAVVVLLLPVGGDTQIKTADAVDAARSAVADLSGFCDRNPATCRTSTEVVGAFGHKMAESAKWAYAIVADEAYVPSAQAPRLVTTKPIGIAPDAPAVAAAAPGATRVIPTDEPNTTVLQRGTLTADDEALAWRGGQRI